MTFGEKLRAARRGAGLTQKELAQRIGAKHNSVSNWEKDQNRPDADMISRLCHALPMRSGYFFDEEPEEQALSQIEFALFGAVRALSEADQQDVLDFARFKQSINERRSRT